MRETESLLREGQEQAQLATAQTLARVLVRQRGVLGPPGRAWHVQQLGVPITLDAYDEEWLAGGAEFADLGEHDRQPAAQAALARSGGALHLFVRVFDASAVRADAHWPQAPLSDHLLLTLQDTAGEETLRLASAAPGPLILAAVGGTAVRTRLLGEWQEDARGYRIELRFPADSQLQALGLAVFDAHHRGAAPRRVAATFAAGADETTSWPVLVEATVAARRLQPLLPDGMRARVLHTDGWVIADAGELHVPQQGKVSGWRRAWRRWMYRWLAADTDSAGEDRFEARSLHTPEVRAALGGDPGSAWRGRGGDTVTLATAVPLQTDGQVRGALLLERETRALLLFADRALAGVLGASLLAMLIAALLLFAFASLLGWRIRRLNAAVERALQRDGRVAGFQRSAARDELGDLSRGFGRLLDEVSAHTDYLRTLAAKLSHELNTPLAIVRSSLDNLQAERLDADNTVYIERARDGADRLGAILRAMSEAGRVERALSGAEAEDFDLAELVRGCAAGYAALLEARELQVQVPPSPLPFSGAPELIAQALDKLFDNARSHCPRGGWIRVSLARAADGARIGVANSGSRLPAGDPARLFDSLVSLRDPARREATHLGLGLYIVRLVAEYHGGAVFARDLPDIHGVEFELRLRPLQRTRLSRTHR